ncbi:MAG TPA: hypothetical protein VHC67_02455 [Gaiellaceae bacterium]|jgi:hypothetical protein|nr:hypothetical protein [Gaiellaceae bacterium]
MSTIRRFAGPLAAVAAAGYCIEGAVVVRAPQPEHGWHASGYVVEVAFALALAASIPLAALLRARLAGAGFAAMLVSALASIVAGGDALGPLFLAGVLASIAGLALLAVSAVRHRAESRWLGPVLVAGFVVSIALGDHGGGIVLGAVWAAAIPAFRDPEPAAAFTLAG